MVKTKDDSVRFKEFTPALVHILNSLIICKRVYGNRVDLVITSANDGSHIKNSRHYTNEAIDLRSKNFESLEFKYAFLETLRRVLGQSFTVLLENVGKENEHFHIQVKKGVAFVEY